MRLWKKIVLLGVFLSLERAQATVWFGFGNEKGQSIVVGLSSGPITDSENAYNIPVGHIPLKDSFVGIGAYVLEYSEVAVIKSMSEKSNSAPEFLQNLSKAYPDRRFILGASDGSVLATKGETGCHSDNYYCGIKTEGKFVIVGGVLASEGVLSNAVNVYRNSAQDTSIRARACKIIDGILVAGGETKEFAYGVTWMREATGQATLVKKYSNLENQLISSLKEEICP